MAKKQKNKAKKVYKILDKVGDGLKKYGAPIAAVVIPLITLGKIKKKP